MKGQCQGQCQVQLSQRSEGSWDKDTEFGRKASCACFLPFPMLRVTGKRIPRLASCWLCPREVVREDWRGSPSSLLLEMLPPLLAASSPKNFAPCRQSLVILTSEQWLRLECSSNLTSSLCPYSLMRGSGFHFTIPGLAS